MATCKERFQEKYGEFTTTTRKYKLTKIKDQSPVVYSADKIMKAPEGKRCDSFVLCCCAPSTTGIYVVEEKKGTARDINKVEKQLQGGANFMSAFLKTDDQFKFLPVLVARGIPPNKRNKLETAKVSLGKEKKYIKHIKPGASLGKLS